MPGDTPRVRFAPSPTGYFHVGSARAALFNWLVARQSGGTFILRIEDTDAERGREEWVDGIVSAMHWLSMDPDEGPYRQSLRTDRYHEAIDALWDGGFLYACDCTRDEIDARNQAAGIQTPGYDNFCRHRGLARGEGRALRFRTPDDGITVVDDVIRGPVEFPCATMDDFVAVKANGAPLFVLANVVDDIDMAITHVIRGRTSCPPPPGGCWCGMPSARSAGGRTVRPAQRSWIRPGCRCSPICPCWSTSSARRSPSAGTRWRWRSTGTRDSWPPPSSTTSDCWAGVLPAARRCSTPIR